MNSPEDLEVAEQVPEDDENEDGAQAAATEFFRSPTRRNTAKQFAHACE
jgi:hypothetical protein